MDGELVSDRYWLDTADEFTIYQSCMSTLFPLNISSNGLFSTECKIDNRHLLYTQVEENSNYQSQDGEVIQITTFAETSENSIVDDANDDDDDTQISSRQFWIPMTAYQNRSLTVKRKLKKALEYLKEITRECEVLIQTWMPVTKEGKCMLSTNNQPFALSPNCKNLIYYRDISRSFQFAGEENSKDFTGLPSRVYLNKLPEWTPDVKFFRKEEYLRLGYAQQFNICGSLGLPIFERDDTTCLGVIEIVTASQRINYQPELREVSKALEAFDLRSSNIQGPPLKKAYDDDAYEASLAEIREMLKFVCDEHGLPLAQTWATCIRQGKSGLRHSHENYAHCVSTIDSACYIPNAQVLGFHEACSEHHLQQGEGLVGEAFMTNQPCFATDISAFSKTAEYPLSHHARMFGLHASIAVRLRRKSSIYYYTTSSADFVLEFFLPSECQNADEQSHLLAALSTSIQQLCRCLRVVTDEELFDETRFLEREISSIPPGGSFDEEYTQRVASYSLSQRPLPEQESSPWTRHIMEDQLKGKSIFVPLGCLEEEPQRKFKLTTHWDDDNEIELHQVAEIITGTDLTLQNFEIKNRVGCDGDSFSVGRQCKSGARKIVQKRQTKSEKTISLQVLRPYFAGSLKDAAKSLGVCPTTLKRICRQHGITRWPSRKIRKVEHSLRKLQLVIDSVQGVEDAIQLSSFCSNTTTQTSPPRRNLLSTHKINDNLRQFTSQREDNLLSDVLTTTNSLSSLCSPARCPENCHNHICLSELPNLHKAQHYPLQKGFRQALQVQTRSIKLKVTFGEERIRFSMQENWEFPDLLHEILKRFNINECESKIEIKYLDDDSEWVLLECNADLKECLDVYKSSGCGTIKLKIHHGLRYDLSHRE